MNSNKLLSKKILILDGISNPPIAKEIYDTLCQQNNQVSYLNPSTFKKQIGHKLMRALTKLSNKQTYYYHPKYSQKVSDTIHNLSPEIILVIGFTYPHVARQTLFKLKKQLKFELFLWDTESGNMLSNPKKLDFFLKNEITLYDHVFSFSKNMAAYMNNLGYKHVSFFPYGSKTAIENTNTSKTQDLLFVGIPDVRRLFYLEKLQDHNINIYGKRWESFSPILSQKLLERITFENVWGNELNKCIKQSKIILNINNHLWNSFESGVNLRIFEALSLKSFILTDYCEELKDLFELGKEIETFKTSEELIDKIDYYLKHDSEREKIAKNGHAKFLKNFTWEARLQKLATLL